MKPYLVIVSCIYCIYAHADECSLLCACMVFVVPFVIYTHLIPSLHIVGNFNGKSEPVSTNFILLFQK